MSEAESASEARRSGPGALHLRTFPDGFEEFADVIFEIGADRLPAHSQYPASHSTTLQHALRDAHSFSEEKPLVLKQTDLDYSASHLECLLMHVYTNVPIQAISDAFDHFRLSKFDSKSHNIP